MDGGDDEIVCCDCCKEFDGTPRQARSRRWVEGEFGWNCPSCIQKNRNLSKRLGNPSPGPVWENEVLPKEEGDPDES